MKQFIDKTSALQFPPAVAAIYGLGSLPYRLYKSIGVEGLHVFDLGPVRETADNPFLMF